MKTIIGASARSALAHVLSLALVLCAWAIPAQAALVLQGTRLVIKSDVRDAIMLVRNNGGSPVLAQSWIDDGRENLLPAELRVPFVLTPPIMRIEPNSAANIRITYTQEPLPTDRESVFYLNVVETPPRDPAVANILQFSFQTRIKIFFRPATLRDEAAVAPDKLTWKLVRTAEGKRALEVSNPTPFHVSFARIELVSGNRKIDVDNGMVAPFAQARFPLLVEASGVRDGAFAVRYEAINDFGGRRVLNKRLLD
ncbi:fimbria/pilus periplasmic chaperone [Achromobacter piechaudii]|uniref:Fimbrial chaperone YadV n=1 Tax=Achromobacter piechaudii TaxID=72556 RepID=A0ABN7FAJ1_9BURK|nr:fimbria/pilus periplasmic chaperone [Achromobacter piechaudii]CAB3737438.1 putative fimbrial chaperone YadV [Achromobacter piechaudii]CAB3922049.1 putative fimbrial chaperone YadV [Achromobacter piechaudii]CAB3958262.1 putative fimbrial chaperone YadV [Achromobacter piechaudii]